MAKRILIADDSVTIQKAFAMTFAAEDVTLLAARSVDEGLSMARQARPDLVVADHSIAGRSGYDLCQAIKSDPALRGVPVYILASLQVPIDEGRLRQCGGDGHLSKPFDTITMLDRVREAIAKGGAATSFAAASGFVPEETFDADSATIRVSPDGMDDYGEIAIVPSTGRDGTPPPEDVVTPPPRLRSPEVQPPSSARPVSIEATSAAVARATTIPEVPAARPIPAQSAPSVAPPRSGGPAAGMRPSLIPGLRPGAVPTAVPATRAPVQSGPGQPSAPLASARAVAPGSASSVVPAASAPTARAPAPPTPSATPAAARTLMGLPAVVAQSPARPTAAPARPGAVAAAQSAMPGVTAPRSASTSSSAASIVAAATSRVDQKMAAIAARGPEYEAIAKLSREIIEKVVWEVVPELAEVIVREELAKRGRI